MSAPKLQLPVESPPARPARDFHDAGEAVDYLIELYEEATAFLRARFTEVIAQGTPTQRYRAFYPEVRLTTTSYAQVDSRLSFGHVAEPGTYSATVSCSPTTCANRSDS